ncbi:uncharacterized protein K02A2.6-like [Armigeres subalbatus]|uniref:uncharacterized protein K02A2.6-like n=1 Tax=Armigeres subalbatus TaxID=124917 RepID=UPI002ED0BBA9
MFGERLVIPSNFRKRCLHHLHRGHPGIQRMKAIARSYVYWPSLDEDIVAHVNSCHHCAAVAKSPAKSEPLSWPKSTYPWQRVHVDYASPIEGEYFLLSVDAHSKWVEIVKTKSTTTSTTIGILRSLFARFGMPETLVSDNGSQFASADFRRYYLENGVQHITTAPYHPQSNGQAERFVDIFKRSVKKIREGKRTIQEALDVFLLTYRTTPNPATPEGKSPSEAMFGRKIRTSLDLLRPTTIPTVVCSEETKTRRTPFKKGDLVYAKIYSSNQWRWASGVVLEPIGRVMFNVWVEDKRMVHAHLNQLRTRSNCNNSSTKLGKRDVNLPLDILLSAWNLSEPIYCSNPVTTPPLPSLSKLNATSISSSTMPGFSSEHSTQLQPASVSEPAQVWVSPEASSSKPTSSSMPSSVTSSSAEFLSANEQTTAVQVPRRSSRARRPPVRFDPYQLY